MTRAIHGTPISPNWLIEEICREAERAFCVSYFRPDQVELVVRLAALVMFDNGAFSAWRKGIILDAAYWRDFFDFIARWLPPSAPGSWFVIPDVIDAGTQEQEALIRECPADLLPFGAPVWHMDEPISRLLALIDRFDRVCIGSTAEYRTIGSVAWRRRMDEAWGEIDQTFGAVPELHMLRGMQCLLPGYGYPFSTVDSTDLGRNHNRLKKRFGADRHAWALKAKADRWDALAAGRPSGRWMKRQASLPGLAA